MTARTFNRVSAQGDIMIIKLDVAPDVTGLTEVQPEGENLIVTHSETGHHHVLERDVAKMYESTDLEAFLVLHDEGTLRHLRDNHTHESLKLPAGSYKVIRAREYTPEGYRRVQD
jgi:hypothetical protein